VLALRLLGVTVGYYLSIFAFMFSAYPLLGFQSQALTLQGKLEIHKSLKVIRCCLGTPSKKWLGPPTSGGEHGPAIRNKS